jgi:hypothetical protein
MTEFKNGQEVEYFDRVSNEWVIVDYTCPHPKIKGWHAIWAPMRGLVIVAKTEIRHIPLQDWPTDHPIEVSCGGNFWVPAHFKGWGEDGCVVVWAGGRTSHSGAATEEYQYYRENDRG